MQLLLGVVLGLVYGVGVALVLPLMATKPKPHVMADAPVPPCVRLCER